MEEIAILLWVGQFLDFSEFKFLIKIIIILISVCQSIKFQFFNNLKNKENFNAQILFKTLENLKYCKYDFEIISKHLQKF